MQLQVKWIQLIQLSQLANRWVFRWRQKSECDWMLLMWTGNEFQAAGPATVNELSANRVLDSELLTIWLNLGCPTITGHLLVKPWVSYHYGTSLGQTLASLESPRRPMIAHCIATCDRNRLIIRATSLWTMPMELEVIICHILYNTVILF